MSGDTFKSLTASAIAACIAETATLPLDTAKVRLQLQNRATGGAPSGVVSTVYNIWQHEGVTALYKGLEAGVHRQLIFTGLRVGLYSDILDYFSPGKTAQDAHIGSRIAAALTTSALGITIANPSDVVKVRTQAYANAGAAARPSNIRRSEASSSVAGTAQAARSASGRRAAHSVAAKLTQDQLYRGPAFRVYGQIVATEGVMGGLYAGYIPNLIRNSIISATELVAYDVTKRALLAEGLSDGPPLHLLSGVAAGLAATALGSPMDVVSTRIMVRRAHGYSAGMVQTCRDMFLKEGLSSFYQGFLPNFARIGSFNVVLWMSFEQLHKLLFT